MASISNPSIVLSIASITLKALEAEAELPLRISVPVDGDRLPIIVFSHGYTQSQHAYGPLVNHWAAHGFVVIQPAHLDAWTRGIAQDDPRMPDLWRDREQDLVQVLDGLDELEQRVPALQGRLDRTRIAVAGHSWGATSASMLLGATHPDPADGALVNITDPRVKAGVLLAVAGTGGDDLSPMGKAYFPFMNPDFGQMRTPALVVAGAKDQSMLSVRGPDWWRDAYDLSPGKKGLFTVTGAEHSLGGIHSHEFDTGDASRARVAAIQRLSTAYLLSALDIDDEALAVAAAAEMRSPTSQGHVETK